MSPADAALRETLRRAPAVAPPPGARGGASSGGSRAVPRPGRRSDLLRLKGELQRRLFDTIDARQLATDDEAVVRAAVREFVAELMDAEEVPLNQRERGRLVEELIDESIGLGPLAPLLSDPAISDILVNGPEQIYVERFGHLERSEVRFRDTDHLLRVIERIAARVGRRIDAAQPMADLRLPDGSRVNATLPPVSPDGPTLSMRRFGRRRLRRADLLRLGSCSEPILHFLAAAVRGRRSILISGGTGAGKSTLLGALAEVIPPGERIVTIEDTLELLLDQEHWVRLETRPPNAEGCGEITARSLVINSLRMRPDRIVIGEVRGGETLDMLQAMNTGHEGGLCTVHANGPREALARIETTALMAGLDLPSRALREQIAAAFTLVVHVGRYEDGVRRVESVTEVLGLEGTVIQLQDLFRFERSGVAGRSVAGAFVATGVTPRCTAELARRGVLCPADWFQREGPRGG